MSQSNPLTIVFAGTPDFAAQSLTVLLASHHRVVGVYTQPDRPAGRGRKNQESPVKIVAKQAGIPVFQPVSLKAEEQQHALAALNPDVMVVVAYGLLLPESILTTPTHGCINVHASLLPRWRGAAPIQRSIIAGDSDTGITIMQMDKGLDTGPMLQRVSTSIELGETAQSLHDRLAIIGAETLLLTLDDMANNRLQPVVQDDSQACYAEKLSKAEALLDWTMPAEKLARIVNAFNPWPVAYTLLDGQPLRIWSAIAQSEATRVAPGIVIGQSKLGIKVATGDGVLLLTTIQMPGKRAMKVSDFINSHDLVNQCLGQ